MKESESTYLLGLDDASERLAGESRSATNQRIKHFFGVYVILLFEGWLGLHAQLDSLSQS